MPHDQLFKDLLRTFFREFMELFFPDVAARLDFSRVTFLENETFTDIPEGEQRRSDLIARVYTLQGQPEIILTHIEVEARHRRSFPRRMHEYYMLLTLRHRMPVFPIAVFLSPGAGGLVTEQCEDRVFDYQVNLFTYQAVGLPDLDADDYQYSENPLGPALSALMKPSRLGKVAQLYQNLRKVAQSRIDEARKSLLINVIETYLTLSTEEHAQFEQLISTPEGEEVGEMITVYEQRGVARGKRDTLLSLMRQKFGDLPESVEAQIRSLSDTNVLDQLLGRILTASTVEDMNMPAPPPHSSAS